MNEVRNIQIGFELKRDFSQLCYFDRRSGEPVSVPTKTGTSLYEFDGSPLAVGRRYGCVCGVACISIIYLLVCTILL